MLDRFLYFIKKNKLFNSKDKILLAVSGGMDSVVMAHLFSKAGFSFAIAHCNFQLRGKESDGDEAFVKALAGKYNVKLYSKRFKTKEEVSRKKISVQMAARDLRYAWFNDLMKKEGYTYVATAHHLNDSIETFFINLLRGTGIEGITGIDVKSNSIIRPLLFASRDEIEQYARANQLACREDSSNQSDDYLRNKIRHHIVPALHKVSPRFEESMAANFSRFAFAEKLFKQQASTLAKTFLKKEKATTTVSLSRLSTMEDADQLLYYLLKEYGFNHTQCEEMLADTATKSGRQFFSATHRAVRNRNKLIIEKISSRKNEKLLIRKQQKKVSLPMLELNTSVKPYKRNTPLPSRKAEQWLDADLLSFPLKLRRWQQGDAFHPLGMNHRKKLSDFFIDNKFSLPEKENTWVLLSRNKIVCILGHRIDNRFRITDRTRNIYSVTIKPL